MARDDRPKGPERGVTALIDRLASILQGLKAERLTAFQEHLHERDDPEAKPDRGRPTHRD
jgi:hypothetical protein